MPPLEMSPISTPGSPFLSLPQELRDHIYEYLLATTFLVKNPHAGNSSSSLPLHQLTDLAILHVSRSIHGEAKKVLCNQGHFRFLAFSTRSPPLHEAIEHIPDFALLQDFILHFNTGAAWLLGYDRLDVVRSGTVLVSHLARLDPGVPRRRFSMEMEYILDANFFFGVFGDHAIAKYPKDAWDFLTGFKIVELKIGHLQPRPLGWILQYEALVEKLAMTLGEGKEGYDEGWLCLTYHPRRG